MIPYLFAIGPVAFNLYGFFIAVGILVFLWAMEHDPRTKNYITKDQLTRLVLYGIACGVLGGRLFYYCTYPEEFKAWYELFALWEPGYSFLGSVIALVIFVPAYLRFYRISWLPVIDIVGVYAPLLQAFGRIGCFCAGCCHGYPTHVSWAVTYTHPDSYAIIGVPCHPTQLYSSLSLLILFLLLRFVIQRFTVKPGQLFAIYLMGAAIERFFNDFWRAEHFDSARLIYNTISIDQAAALGVLCVGLIFLCWTSWRTQKPSHIDHA